MFGITFYFSTSLDSVPSLGSVECITHMLIKCHPCRLQFQHWSANSCRTRIIMYFRLLHSCHHFSLIWFLSHWWFWPLGHPVDCRSETILKHENEVHCWIPASAVSAAVSLGYQRTSFCFMWNPERGKRAGAWVSALTFLVCQIHFSRGMH